MKPDSVLLIVQNLSIVEKLLSTFNELLFQIEINHVLTYEEALKLSKTVKPNLIIADHTESLLEYKEIIETIRNYSPNDYIHFVAICKNQNQLKAFQQGFNDCITYPFDTIEYNTRIQNILSISYGQYQRTFQNSPNEENEVLKAIVENTKELLSIRIPSYEEILSEIETISIWIAKEFKDFDDEELQDLRYASTFWAVGKLVLPDTDIRLSITKDGFLDGQFMSQIPVISSDSLKNKPYFANVIPIVEAIFENFDGTGFPNGMQSWQIPLASRLLRVVIDFEESLVSFQGNFQKSLEYIKLFSGKIYDQRFVVLLEQYLTEVQVSTIHHKIVNMYEIKEGMVLSKDIVTNSGIKLVPKGSTLTKSAIEKIIKMSGSDPIIGRIYITVSNEN